MVHGAKGANLSTRLKVPITRVPCKLLCVLSLFVSRAIADNAFLADYRSPDEVLNPSGTLEPHITYTPVPWKPEMLEEEIVPISYHQYWTIWNRTLLVAGLRDQARPYALRVGTGRRLDGRRSPVPMPPRPATDGPCRKPDGRTPQLHSVKFDGRLREELPTCRVAG